MNRLLLLFLLILSSSYISWAQNIPPEFSRLEGMEDSQGYTHLLYRIHWSNTVNPMTSSGDNSIYNMVPGTPFDVLFLNDSYYCDWYFGSGRMVADFDFWNTDLSKYIYCGSYVNCFEPAPYISRYDSENVFIGFLEMLNNISISKQDDSLVYCGKPLMKSTDGGYNWGIINDTLSFLSLSPFNDNIFFAIGPFWNHLYKTTNAGGSYSLVDTVQTYPYDIYYDQNTTCIYRNDEANLRRSFNEGNAFSWENIYTGTGKLSISLDNAQSGALYVADGRRILYSSDYGSNFTLKRELEKRIVGIYKRPGADKLYAATKYRIYEISSDSIAVIKSLPIPDTLLSMYPLKTGSKWVYNFSFVDWIMGGYEDIYYREVLSEKIKPNGKKYFEVYEKYVYTGIKDTVYERIDSLEGKVYRYAPSCPGSEQLIDDLVMEVGDSSYASRFGSCTEYPPTILEKDTIFNKWGLSGREYDFINYNLFTADYRLMAEIGLGYIRISDDNGTRTFTLKGMLRDGVVYGDTTLTDAEDTRSGIPSEYALEQNYPNPFNPSTKIRWQIPEGSWQSIKVYDILGNEIAVLVDEYRNAGNYQVEFDARSLPSGVYFYRLNTGRYSETRKMMVVK